MSGGLWDYWQSVRSNVIEGVKSKTHEFLQQHAGESALLKATLTDLGRQAGEYIDRADRQIEQYENSALGYLKQQGEVIRAQLQKEYNQINEEEREPSLLFHAGSDRVPVSRLDAQLMALHTSPALILDHKEMDKADLPQERIDQLLRDNKDLEKLHRQLVPEQIGYEQFWLRYFDLRSDLEQQDQKRKELLAQQAVDEDEGWGSSDEQ